MNEALAPLLGELAELLRKRIAQVDRADNTADEQRREAAAAKAQMLQRLSGHSGFSFARAQERVQEMETRADEERAAQQQFREELLAELRRHNAALERLVEELVRRS